MIMQCIADLRVFLTTFFMMMIFFGMMLSVLGPDPSLEYRIINKFLGNIMSSVRISLGDFNFAQLDILTPHESGVYWIVWTLVFMLGCLIFLNFIIAEVGESYAQVSERIDSLIWRERATMVKEVEDFLSEGYKRRRKQDFPKYVVVREAEE